MRTTQLVVFRHLAPLAIAVQGILATATVQAQSATAEPEKDTALEEVLVLVP